MIYVTSDIHGQYNMFLKLLSMIEFSDSDTLYILGDVVDRGSEPIRILQYISKRSNIKLLRGNHEEFMLDYFEQDCYDNGWFSNGGGTTYEQLLSLGEDEMQKILLYVRRTKYVYEIEVNEINYKLCHAGLQYDQNGILYKPFNKDFILWARDEFIRDTFVKDDVVIFGHTPTKYIHGKYDIWYGTNKIGIDCGATFGHKLACLRLDDMEEFYIE